MSWNRILIWGWAIQAQNKTPFHLGIIAQMSPIKLICKLRNLTLRWKGDLSLILMWTFWNFTHIHCLFILRFVPIHWRFGVDVIQESNIFENDNGRSYRFLQTEKMQFPSEPIIRSPPSIETTINGCLERPVELQNLHNYSPHINQSNSQVRLWYFELLFYNVLFSIDYMLHIVWPLMIVTI